MIENIPISCFDGLPIGVIIIDHNGKFIYLNRMAYQLPEIVIHENITDYDINEILPNSPLNDVIKTKEERVNIKRKLGQKTFLNNCYPILMDNGHLLGAIEFVQDADQYEKIENEYNTIKELNIQFQIIIKNSSDGIFVTDGEGTILTSNPAMMKNIGLEDDSQLLGKNVDVLEKEGIISESVIKKVIETKRKETVLTITQTGEKLISTANPVFNDNGRMIKVISNCRNITDIIEMKEKFIKEKELTEFYKKQVENRKYLDQIVAKSNVMRMLINKATKIAEYDTTVLMLGESGVGKTEFASLIHKLSPRAKYPFIQINCSAIPDNLLESELFGYEPGAFSGAKKGGDIGKLELANNGVLLLDEVAELPLQQQAKLLQVINEKTFMRVGGKELIHVNLRIISATNKNLEELVKRGEFRDDLYYRLHVITFLIPPIRDRKEDIPNLMKHFLDNFNNKYGLKKTFSHKAVKLLEKYDWPGNIRELKNVIEQMVILSENSIISEDDIPVNIYEFKKEYMTYNEIEQIQSLKDLLEETERRVITLLYQRYKSSYRIANILKISQTTAMRKIYKYIKNIELEN